MVDLYSCSSTLAPWPPASTHLVCAPSDASLWLHFCKDFVVSHCRLSQFHHDWCHHPHMRPTRWPENEAVQHCHQMDHVNRNNRELCSCLAGHADALPLRTQQCWWLVVWCFPVSDVIASWIAAQACMLYSHCCRTLSVIPLSLVRPPRIFRDLIRTCSITMSVHNPAHSLSLLRTVWYPSTNFWWSQGWVDGSLRIS